MKKLLKQHQKHLKQFKNQTFFFIVLILMVLMRMN